jgi:S-adenosylmethionine-dependent methyltransferase
MDSSSQSPESLRASFDKIAAIYDNETSTLAHRVNEFVTKENLFSILSTEPAVDVVDAGGGTGKWVTFLSQLGCRVTLIDISPKSLDIARQNLNKLGITVNIMEANVESTSLSSESMDFILSQGPMSYTPNPSIMLQEMARILRLNGRIWLDYYNTVGWALESTNLKNKNELVCTDEMLLQMPDWDYPIRTFSLKRVNELCRSAGFNVEVVYGNHILMNSLPLSLIYSNQYTETDLMNLQTTELKLGRDLNCVGASKSCQIVARKIRA